jgi:hypothetical protein
MDWRSEGDQSGSPGEVWEVHHDAYLKLRDLN